MVLAFNYAINQALGLQFEHFMYTINGVRYIWEPHWIIVKLCQWFMFINLSFTQWVFNRFLSYEVVAMRRSNGN